MDNSHTQTSARTSSLACLCDPGHEAVDGRCEPCAAGKTKLTLSDTDRCVQCPQHSTLRVGSLHLSEKCECDPGYVNKSVVGELSD
jgi:hypothetical protein